MKLGSKISLYVSLILVIILMSSAWAFIYYEAAFFERNIRDKADRTLTVLEAHHTQAMLHRGDVRDQNPVIESLNGTFKQLSETSTNMTLWLVMGPKVLAYQQARGHIEREPPRDAVDREALASRKTVARVTEAGEFRLTRPVVLGRGNARFAACTNCHGRNMGIAEGEVIGAYSIKLSIVDDQMKLDNTRLAVIILSLIASVGVALVSSLLLSRLAVRPLEKMTATMAQLARGDLNVEIPFQQRRDEIGEMAHSVEVFKENASARKDAEDSVRRQQAELARVLRRSTLGEMASALAHELGQPLGTISAYCGGLSNHIVAGDLDEAELTEVLQKISDTAHHASQITGTIADHVRGTEPSRSVCDINEVIRSIVPIIEADTREATCTFKLELMDEKQCVLINRTEIESVVINLVRNAVDAMAETPIDMRQLKIFVSMRDSRIEIAVSDSGRGFPKEDTEHLFKPFFTTKTDGIGMGLAISQTIVEAHGGRFSVDAKPDHGATFRFTLPPANEETIDGA